jgi:coenzyme F420-0:L-glutamate ligase/coenzyme F420-1:gamma-L-glutamate ligase
MSGRIEIWGVDGIPEVEPGDDLATLLIRATPALQDGDVVVVTSKIVSKAEGRLVPGTRDDHLASQTARIVAQRGTTQIVETHHGLVLAAAGIDASNVPEGSVALLPLDSDASARRIRDSLRADAGVDVAVIISDTMGRPWRDGLVDTAIGAAGLDVLWDLRGQHDTAGHLLEATVIAVGDELAAAADLVKGKLASTPIAVVRGFPYRRTEPDLGARPLIRPSADDMFRLGTREAKAQVVRDSAPVSARDLVANASEDQRRLDRKTIVNLVLAAVDSVRGSDVALSVASEGGTVTAAGEPLAVGIVLGRLLAALAAVELRGNIEEMPPGAESTAKVHVVLP